MNRNFTLLKNQKLVEEIQGNPDLHEFDENVMMNEFEDVVNVLNKINFKASSQSVKNILGFANSYKVYPLKSGEQIELTIN
jgi:hypothetical protein